MVKDVLSSPLTVVSPVKRLSLTLYLTSIKKFINALLAQEVEGVERAVLYLTGSLRGAQLNYPSIKCHCLALVFATENCDVTCFATPTQLTHKVQPISILLSNPAMSGRIAIWLLQLNKFDITIVTPKGLRSQAF